jgi:restriction endonuclease S subunit
MDQLISALRRIDEAILDAALSEGMRKHQPIPLAKGCLRVTDGTHQPPTFTSSGIPFFLVKTISSGIVDWSHTKFVNQQTYEQLTRRVKPKRGDILYTAVGSYGVAVLVDFDEPFVFQRHIAHIVPDPAWFEPRYVELFLNSRHGRQQSDQAAVGSAQPTVTLTALGSFGVPPLSLREQQLLCKQSDAVRRKHNAVQMRRESMRSFRAAVLSSVMSGGEFSEPSARSSLRRVAT